MNGEIQNSKNLSDDALFERIMDKDVDAFSILYDRYSPVLYGVAHRILQEQTKAEDVLQEVFLKIWRNASQFDKQRGSLRGWMIRICRNMCIDHHRARRTPESHSVALDEKYVPQSHGITADHPVEQVNHQEMHAVVSKALEKLPAEQSLLIEMAYFQGFSQSELAEKLNLPLGTVKTRMRLAMKKLRESLITNPDYKGFTK